MLSRCKPAVLCIDLLCSERHIGTPRRPSFALPSAGLALRAHGMCATRVGAYRVYGKLSSCEYETSLITVGVTFALQKSFNLAELQRRLPVLLELLVQTDAALQ